MQTRDIDAAPLILPTYQISLAIKYAMLFTLERLCSSKRQDIIQKHVLMIYSFQNDMLRHFMYNIYYILSSSLYCVL